MDIKVMAAQFVGEAFKRCFGHFKRPKVLLAILLGMAISISSVSAASDQPPTGLRNWGNTCFVNATLQCLFKMNGLNASLRQIPNPAPIVQEYLRLIDNHANIEIFIGSVRTTIGMARGQQQDAHEFLMRFLDILDPRAAFVRLQGTETTTCGTCHTASANAGRPFTLELEIDQPGSCFDRYFMQGETVSANAGNGWRCPQCQRPVDATKKYTLQTLPDYLTIQLKRFRQQSVGVYQRLDAAVSYPEKFSFDPRYFVPQAHVPHAYELFGVVMQTGSLTGGHYTAYVKHNNSWMLCSDDAQIVPRPLPQNSSEPYILFYRKTTDLTGAMVQGPMVTAEHHGTRRNRTDNGAATEGDSDGEGGEPDAQRRRTENGAAAASAANQPAQNPQPPLKRYNEQDFLRAKNGAKDLKNAQLEGAAFGENIDLSGVDFTGAILDGAQFTGTNMANANLTNVQAKGAVFVGANLTGATIIGKNANFEGCDFTRATLDHATITDANLAHCNFTGARIINNTVITNTNLTWAKFHRLHLNNTIFDNTDLSHVEIFDAIEINDTTFRNQTRLIKGQLKRSTFFQNTFNEVNLSEATFERVQFSYPTFNHVNMREIQAHYLRFLNPVSFIFINLTSANVDGLLISGLAIYGRITFDGMKLRNSCFIGRLDEELSYYFAKPFHVLISSAIDIPLLATNQYNFYDEHNKHRCSLSGNYQYFRSFFMYSSFRGTTFDHCLIKNIAIMSDTCTGFDLLNDAPGSIFDCVNCAWESYWSSPYCYQTQAGCPLERLRNARALVNNVSAKEWAKEWEGNKDASRVTNLENAIILALAYGAGAVAGGLLSGGNPIAAQVGGSIASAAANYNISR